SARRELRRSVTWSLALGSTHARLPVARLSTIETRCPARMNASTTWEPIKPAPPVTRMFTLRSRQLAGAAGPLERLREALPHAEGRPPAEQALRLADVGLAHLGVVDGQRAIHDLALPARDPH